MSAFELPSRKLEQQSQSMPQLQEQGPFTDRDSPHQQIVFPSTTPSNLFGILQGSGLPGAPFSVNGRWHSGDGNGHGAPLHATPTMPSNGLPVDSRFPSSNKIGHFTSPISDQHQQGLPGFLEAKREPAYEIHTADNVFAAGAIDPGKHPSWASGIPQFNIQPISHAEPSVSNPEHIRHAISSPTDTTDNVAIPPVERELTLARRRSRALSLKLSRRQRRLAAASATKARSASVTKKSFVKGPKDEEQEKLQRRVSNRNSVERCRNKKKQLLNSLVKERRELERENGMMRDLLMTTEATGLTRRAAHLSQTYDMRLPQA